MWLMFSLAECIHKLNNLTKMWLMMSNLVNFCQIYCYKHDNQLDNSCKKNQLFKLKTSPPHKNNLSDAKKIQNVVL